MAVDKIDSVHGGASQTPEKVWAAQLAAKLEEVRRANSSVATPVGMSTGAPFAPAIYAQAAQFQLYTQAGTLAALNSGAASAAASQKTPQHTQGIQVTAVEKTGGATVNTLA